MTDRAAVQSIEQTNFKKRYHASSCQKYQTGWRNTSPVCTTEMMSNAAGPARSSMPVMHAKRKCPASPGTLPEAAVYRKPLSLFLEREKEEFN